MGSTGGSQMRYRLWGEGRIKFRYVGFIILVLHCNYMSIVNRFRYNELFMFAGNDVMSISSLGGASAYF